MPPLTACRHTPYKIDFFPTIREPQLDSKTMELAGRVLAGLGAGMILAALTFVTLLIGVLVNSMVVLMAGPMVDKMMKEKSS